jgi:hypothetical protein
MFEGLDRFYSTVMFRDMKFVFLGGAPVLLSIYFARPSLFQEGGGLVIGMCVCLSYLVGIVLFHAAMVLPTRRWSLIAMYPRDRNFEKTESDFMITLSRIRKSSHYDQKYFERVVYIKEITGTICVGSLACLAILAIFWLDSIWVWWPKLASPNAIRFNEWGFGIVTSSLAIAAIVSWYHNRSKASVQFEMIKQLENDLGPIRTVLGTAGQELVCHDDSGIASEKS